MTADTLVVLADIHGNRWALEAVLEDIVRWGDAPVVDLGDSLFGPLDPAGTARVLDGVAAVSIRGNQDRAVLQPGPESDWSPTLRFTLEALSATGRTWLEAHRPTARILDDRVFLCHGTPSADDVCLVERVTENGVELTARDSLAAALSGLGAEIVLCAHSHVPRCVGFDGGLVVNPGSVGLPAYEADAPFPHAMESGSPHARYAVLRRQANGWSVEHVAVPYDHAAAARAAEANGRPDWARWLRTGRGS